MYFIGTAGVPQPPSDTDPDLVARSSRPRPITVQREIQVVPSHPAPPKDKDQTNTSGE